jgi:hypothetical protein
VARAHPRHHRTNPSRAGTAPAPQWPDRDGQHAGRPQRRRSPASRPTGTRRPCRRRQHLANGGRLSRGGVCLPISPRKQEETEPRSQKSATPESGSRSLLARPANSERRGRSTAAPALCAFRKPWPHSAKARCWHRELPDSPNERGKARGESVAGREHVRDEQHAPRGGCAVKAGHRGRPGMSGVPVPPSVSNNYVGGSGAVVAVSLVVAVGVGGWAWGVDLGRSGRQGVSAWVSRPVAGGVRQMRTQHDHLLRRTGSRSGDACGRGRAA